MTPEQGKQLQELHDFWMKPPVAGRPSRAQLIDEVLRAYTAGGIVVRVFLWGCAAIVAVASAWGATKGWFTKP